MRRVAILVAFLLPLALVSPATAYPPGQEMTIVASKPQVLKGDAITLTIRNAAPGQLTLRLVYTSATGLPSDVTKQLTVSQAGEVKTYQVGMSKYGILKATATDATNAVAITRVFVPRLTVPDSVAKGGSGVALVQFARPGTIFKFFVPGMLSQRAKQVGQLSKAKIRFVMRKSGPQPVSASVGRIPFQGLKITGE